MGAKAERTAMRNVVDQLRYGRWANLELAKAAMLLSPEEFTRATGSSFTSIHATLVHLLWAEQLWFARWSGGPPVPKLNPETLPTADAVHRGLELIHAEQLAFLGTSSSEHADRPVSYRNAVGETWSYSLRDMVQHVVIHSAFHRGQIATLFRQIGKAAPHTDYLVYVDVAGTAGM